MSEGYILLNSEVLDLSLPGNYECFEWLDYPISVQGAVGGFIGDDIVYIIRHHLDLLCTDVGRAILNEIFLGVFGPRMHVYLCKNAIT